MGLFSDKQRASRALPVFLAAGLGLALLAALLILWSHALQDEERDYRQHLAELTMVTAALPGQSAQLLSGGDAARSQLVESQAKLKQVLEQVESGAGIVGVFDSPSARRIGGDPAWDELASTLATVLEGDAAIKQVKGTATQAREVVPRFVGDVASALQSPGAGAATRLMPQIEALGRELDQDLSKLAAAGGDSAAAAKRIDGTLTTLAQLLRGLAAEASVPDVPPIGGEALARLRTAQATLGRLTDDVRAVLARVGPARAAATAAGNLAKRSDALYDKLARYNVEPAPSGLFAGPWPALVVLGFAMFALAAALLAWASAATLRKAADQAQRQNQRNQDAILRLLDEMSSLADGDLTVQATVTDDITGAIADAINYAIEALRDLVATINETAVSLDAAARQTQAAAGHLAKASGAQSRQVAAATDAVTSMASSIEEVSSNSERSADVARHAVDVAHKGADAVRRTIDGMNAIRENIQETSKRIKRLGESSQEIGNIVELINDIAEQTNILALNASIQASMAGDAGRGFAVVADEVQRLAERAGNATRQIEVLVRTIQADTNEAVVSMERTTTDVVGGALLAENAGAALGEIEGVSNQIAQHVHNISGSARAQAAAAAHITRTMQVLREISQQTADSTSATSGAIGRLAEMSAQLRRSVAGFRLPPEAVPEKKVAAVAPVAPAPEPRRASAGG